MSIPNRIARLEPNGSTDSTFTPGMGLNGPGLCLALLPATGQVIVGGEFTVVCGRSRPRLAFFSDSGTLADTTVAANQDVHALAVQADGKVLVAGAFDMLGGEARNRLARLKADLTVEAAYDPNASATVHALAIAADGKTICGGEFAAMGGQSRMGLVRLHNQPAANELAVESAAEITWLCGVTAPETQRVTFEISTDAGETWSPLGGTVARAGEGGGWKVTGLSLSGAGHIRARVHPGDGHSEGLLEAVTAFDFVPDIAVALGSLPIGNGDEPLDLGELQTGGARDFTFTISNMGLVPLNLTGTPIAAMDGASEGQFSIVSQPPATLAPRSQATFVLRFAPTSPGVKVDELTLETDDPEDEAFTIGFTATATKGPGGRDSAFTPLLNNYPQVAAASADHLLIGGSFTTVTGVAQARRARLTHGGALVPEPAVAFNNTVTGIAMMPDGRVVFSGDFGGPGLRLTRLNVDGTLDRTFSVAVNQTIKAMVVQSDGALIIGGLFTRVKNIVRNGLARVLPNGTVDPTWNPSFAGDALALQADGKLLVRQSAAGSPLLRLNPDGTRDLSFTPSGFEAAGPMIVTAEGKILLAATVSGITALRRLHADGSLDADWSAFAPGLSVHRLAMQADGRILVSYQVEGTHKLARLTAAGEVDSTFIVPESMHVTALALGPQGQIFAGGRFTLDGATLSLARLINDANGYENTLTIHDETSISWLRTGTLPEAQDVVLYLSQDAGATWRALGRAQRMADGWRLDDLRLPISGAVRASARVFHPPCSSALQDQQVAVPAGLPVPDLDVEYPAGTVFTVKDVTPRAGAPTSDLLNFPAALPPPTKEVSGQSSEVTVLLRNRGRVSLTNIEAKVSDGWAISSAPPASIPAGGSASLVVRFTPDKVAYKTGTLTITSDVPGLKSSYPIALRGPGLAKPLIIATPGAINITSTQARLRVTVRANDDNAKIRFRYKKQSQSEESWITVPPSDPLLASGYTNVALEHNIAGLTPGTAYHYQALISNSFNPSAPIEGPIVPFFTL